MFTIEYTSLGQTERLRCATEAAAATQVRARWGADGRRAICTQWGRDGKPWVSGVEEEPCVLIWPPAGDELATGRVFGPAGWAPDAALWLAKPEESIFQARVDLSGGLPSPEVPAAAASSPYCDGSCTCGYCYGQ